MINPIENTTQDALFGMLDKIGVEFESDAICIHGPITPDLVTNVYDTIEETKKKRNLFAKVVVVLTTNGGDANSTERIADTLHANYSEVELSDIEKTEVKYVDDNVETMVIQENYAGIDNNEETDCTILQLVLRVESFGESK